MTMSVSPSSGRGAGSLGGLIAIAMVAIDSIGDEFDGRWPGSADQICRRVETVAGETRNRVRKVEWLAC